MIAQCCFTEIRLRQIPLGQFQYVEFETCECDVKRKAKRYEKSGIVNPASDEDAHPDEE